MPITLNGSGTVTGISAGGLPDGCITAAELASGVGGKILQVVQTTKTDVFTTTTTSYSDITGMSANITMTSSSNKVLVLVQQQIVAGDAGTGIKIVRGSTDIFLADAAGSRARHTMTGNYDGETTYSGGGACFIGYLDTPGAGTHTYKVQCMTRGGTIYVNRTNRDSDDTNASRSTSSITLQEVAA
jgi:hypothetical protein|tara:strand:+ start:18 stop:575 length:558 start_codon:yes stop_codon:yes gene_type:complete